MLTHEAVQKLTTELKNDPELWNSYKANIAMTVYDEFMKNDLPIDHLIIMDIANNAAENFLNLWCDK